MNNLIDKDITDGLVVEPAKSALPIQACITTRSLRNRNPDSVLQQPVSELELPCVSMNDEQVGKRKAVEYRLRTVTKTSEACSKATTDRAFEVQRVLSGILEAGIKVKDANVVWLDTEDFLDLDQWSDYLFHRLEGCTGWCATTMRWRMCCQVSARSGAFVIPDQLSIVSVDNSDLATLASVKLTSFPHPMEALGRKAAENMISMIENPYFDGNYLFDSDIIERDSVKVLERPRKEGM